MNTRTTLSIALGATLALSGSAFALSPLERGYQLAAQDSAATTPRTQQAEGSCGGHAEGSCGAEKAEEGSCGAAAGTPAAEGEGSCGAAHAEGEAEGSCGGRAEGSCGAAGGAPAEGEGEDAAHEGAEGTCGEGKCGGTA